jgi:hypothetical protein
MAQQALKAWEAEVAAKYGSNCIERANSFAARGAMKTRKVLARVKSPQGAEYIVFSVKTNSQK